MFAGWGLSPVYVLDLFHPHSTIYVGGDANDEDSTSTLFAIWLNGTLRWNFSVLTPGNQLFTSPGVDSAGRLWVGGNTRPDNSDDHVYPSFLYVLNASTGALIVQLTDGYFGAITTSILLTSDGTAVFGTSARQGVSTDMAAVYAVWPNCTLRWEFFTGGPQPGNFVGSPTEAPDGSVIYVAATNGIVYTVNASSRNGASYAVFATTGSMYDPWTVTASPAASSDGTVYFASNPIGSGPGSDGALFAVHADGTALWNFSFPGDGVGGGRSGSAAVISPDGSTVYISADAGEGSGGSLYALNARDGSLLWEAPGSFSGLSSSPVLAGDVLYAGGGIANTLFAINATTGTQVWNLSTVAPYGIYVDIGIGGDGTLYLTNAGSLVAISDAGGAA